MNASLLEINAQLSVLSTCQSTTRDSCGGQAGVKSNTRLFDLWKVRRAVAWLVEIAGRRCETIYVSVSKLSDRGKNVWGCSFKFHHLNKQVDRQ